MLALAIRREYLMLKRIKIQGYKSLVDVEVHLQPLTVLFGPNASGKSNFLDALQLLSRIASSKKLNDAFEPPYRGTALESLSFSRRGVQGLLA
jgi:AAA15 family ATPase/GTPase